MIVGGNMTRALEASGLTGVKSAAKQPEDLKLPTYEVPRKGSTLIGVYEHLPALNMSADFTEPCYCLASDFMQFRPAPNKSLLCIDNDSNNHGTMSIFMIRPKSYKSPFRASSTLRAASPGL